MINILFNIPDSCNWKNGIRQLLQTNIQLLANFWLHQMQHILCCKVFFKIFHIELWDQLTLRSITLLSSLVSWLTVALPSWGQTKTNHHLWNIHQSNPFPTTGSSSQQVYTNEFTSDFRLDRLNGISSHMPLKLLLHDIVQAKAVDKKNKTMRKTFPCRRYCQFQGHTCRAFSEDSLGLELMACISTSCIQTAPHTGTKG